MKKRHQMGNIIVGILISFLLSGCTALDEKDKAYHTNQESSDIITQKEALDLVFDYEYASWEDIVDISFYETEEVIGYKWLTKYDMECPMYLTIKDCVVTSQGDKYCIVRLAKDIYGSSGVYYRTETYNEFAVNMENGKIIEMRVYLEEGGWDYSEEYRKLGDVESSEPITSQESVKKMTKREALDTLFDYLCEGGERPEEVTFFEEKVIGYKWTNDPGSRNTYLSETCFSENGEYLIFELYNELYGSTGIFIRTQMLNNYAVDIQTGEVIPRKIDKEDGTWEHNEDYDKVLN